MLTPTDIKQLCAQYGLSPSKAYGQNYLITDAPIRTMIDAAKILPTETVVEVGPGFGVLTEALAGVAKNVIAFEIEQTLRDYWTDRQRTLANVEVIWGNALTMFPAYAQKLPSYGYSVVANVPYNITSDLIRLFLESDAPPRQVICMVQKEVAERLTAGPGDMSLLALSVQYYGSAKTLRIVPRGCFFPAPKVDSAVIQIVLRTEARVVLPELFFRVVRAGFAQKRKKLVSNLSGGLGLPKEQVAQALERAHLTEGVRAESLSVEAWETVAQHLGLDA